MSVPTPTEDVKILLVLVPTSAVGILVLIPTSAVGILVLTPTSAVGMLVVPIPILAVLGGGSVPTLKVDYSAP